MDFICLTIVVVGLLYTVLILFFTAGWGRKHNTLKPLTENSTFISVVVAARNEEKQIPLLLDALKTQTFKNFEVIVVDDHSTDNTAKIVSESSVIDIKLIPMPDHQYGKKAAVATAILQAKGELIVTTDADCVPGRKWLKAIVDFYESENADFIIGPVKHSGKRTILQKLFSLDFLSLQASGAGAAEMKKPFLCNGANMALKKTLWQSVSQTLTNPFASGDDVFLLHSAIKNNPAAKIRFLLSENSIVTTPAPASVSGFFSQRIRWASKAKGYKNSMAGITSIFVFLMNFCLFVLFVGSFFSVPLFYYFSALFLLKVVIDLPLLSYSAAFFKERKLMLYYIPLQILYFTYTTFIAICSLFGSYKWKDRKI